MSAERFHLPLFSYGVFLALAAPLIWFALSRRPNSEKESSSSTAEIG